jgi:hypothetical protein
LRQRLRGADVRTGGWATIALHREVFPVTHKDVRNPQSAPSVSRSKSCVTGFDADHVGVQPARIKSPIIIRLEADHD